MNDHEILEEIYQIYYCGKMFNKELLIENIRQDHEIVIRLNERLKKCDQADTSEIELEVELQKIRDGK